ncbi:hypothetical protein GCM10022254_62450 [Actinomadura meridiana]|uniref:Circularly permuted type 2 ATP-grasp protein n=1 Tax=Actinomadura meridiana TaxID=559626 RepID=A0ABP8CIZ7_9ACTN
MTSWYGNDPVSLESRVPLPEIDRELETVREGEHANLVPESLDAMRPFVLPPRSYDEMYRVATVLLDLLRRTLFETAPTAAGRIAALDAPEDIYPLLMDGPFEDDYATCMARPDIVVDATGPKFVEFNIGSGLGGVVDTFLHTNAWIAAFGGPDAAPFTTIDPLAVRDQIFVRAVRRLSAEPAVAVVGTFRDFGGKPSRYFEVQLESLAKRGLKAVHLEPEELPDALGLPGKPRYQVGMRHFTILEWRALRIDLAPVHAALDSGCLLIASQTAYMVANKKVLAWLSEGRPWMTDGHRAIVRRYLPWTRVVQDGPVDWKRAKRPLPELLVNNREWFVLKPAIGMSGQQVLVGRHCDDDTWKTAVTAAVATRDHIVQEYVEAAPYLMEFADADRRGTFEAEVFPVVSPYVFDGRPGGCMVRYLAPNQRGVVAVHGGHARSNVALRGLRRAA